MKHVVIGSNDMGFPGGVTTVAKLLKKGFERRGIDARLMSLDYEGARESGVYSYGWNRSKTLRNVEVSRNRVGLVKWAFYAAFTPVAAVIERVRFVRFLQSLGPDTCFIFFKPFLHVELEKRHAKKLHQFTIVEQFHSNIDGLASLGWDDMYRELAPRVDKFLALDPRVAQHLGTAIGVNVGVMRNPLETDSLRTVSPIDDRPRRVAIVARLSGEKRLDLSIEAFARATQGDSDWSMSIYGDGPDQARLASLIEHLNLSDRVTLEGYTSAPLDAFSCTQIMMLNSVFEGMPMTVLEGFAVGVPLVATDACETVERAALQAGRLVREAECADREALVEALAASLKELMSDDAERERLSVEARKFVEPFALDAVVDEWIALIDSL